MSLEAIALKIHSLQIVFTVSLMTSLFWLTGFVWEPVFREEPPIIWLFLISVGCVAFIALIAFRQGRMLLPQEIPLVELIKEFLGNWLILYVVFIPIVGVVTWMLVQAFSANPGHPEVSIYVAIMAVWFPLWPSPMAASFLTWRKLIGRYANGF